MTAPADHLTRVESALRAACQKAVTVENHVSAKASMSAEQIQAYLWRTGWEVCSEGHLWQSWTKEIGGREAGMSVPRREDYADFDVCLGRAVCEIAMAEERLPSEVLFEIAKEPEP